MSVDINNSASTLRTIIVTKLAGTHPMVTTVSTEVVLDVLSSSLVSGWSLEGDIWVVLGSVDPRLNGLDLGIDIFLSGEVWLSLDESIKSWQD